MLGVNRYGKSRIRVMKVTREEGVHRVSDWTVEILVEGDFEACFVDGDNSRILPTDTMKNAVYSRARASAATSMEEFALDLGAFLLGGNPQLDGIEVGIAESRWERVAGDPTTFRQSGPERSTAHVSIARGHDPIVRAGVKGLVILKTAKSAFSGFEKDALTTLPDTDDRLLCTEADIDWSYAHREADYAALRARVLGVLLSAFADHESASVQHTLYAMGQAALEAEPGLAEIDLTMPNRHCLLVNLAPFGQDNPNTIFVPTDEPHGTIQARILRHPSPAESV